MELDDCAFPLLQSMVPPSDPMAAFKDVDVALLVGARPRPGHGAQGPARSQRRDLHAAGQGAQRPRLARREGAGGGQPGQHQLPDRDEERAEREPAQFTAMMRLDHNRALSQVGREDRQARHRRPQKMIIWGNHSATQYPTSSTPRSTARRSGPLINDQAWTRQTFIPTVQKRGAAIIEARGLSSAARGSVGRHRPRARLALGRGTATG